MKTSEGAVRVVHPVEWVLQIGRPDGIQPTYPVIEFRPALPSDSDPEGMRVVLTGHDYHWFLKRGDVVELNYQLEKHLGYLHNG